MTLPRPTVYPLFSCSLIGSFIGWYFFFSRLIRQTLPWLWESSSKKTLFEGGKNPLHCMSKTISWGHDTLMCWKLINPLSPNKCRLLLSIYSQLCVLQYGEFGRSLVGVKVSLTTNSPNAVHTFCSGQVRRIKVRIFGVHDHECFQN